MPRRSGTRAPLEPAAVRRRRDRLSPARRAVLPGPGARSQRRLPLQGLVQDPPGWEPSSPPPSATCAPPGPPRRRGPHHSRHPHRPDNRPGQERAPPPAHRRARGGAAPCSSSTPATAPPPLPTGWPDAPPISWSGSPPAACSLRRTTYPAGTAARAAVGSRCTAWSRRVRGRRRQGSGPGAGRTPPPEPGTGRGPHPPRTPLYGTVRAEAWHRVRPLIHGDRGWFAGRKSCPSCAAPSSTSPSSACPTAATPTAPCGCGTPARPAVPGRALARLPRPLRHRARLQAPQGHPRPHRRQGKDPGQADRCARLVMAARPSSCLPGPSPATSAVLGKQPGPFRPLTPGRVRRGFRNIRRDLGTPARVAKPSPRARQAQRQRQRPTPPLPPPRRSRHATHRKTT